MNNIDKLKKISTPAEENWFEIAEEWEKEDKEMDKLKHEVILPEGYIFKDESGNIINATKIILEKKEKYPKTYEECCQILRIEVRGFDILYNMLDTSEKNYCNNLDRLLNTFRKLLICRDAYWKIAGEEMGLGGSWKPDWNHLSDKWVLFYTSNRVGSQVAQTRHSVFAFPTEKMRDAFYENFKVLIERCKELL